MHDLVLCIQIKVVPRWSLPGRLRTIGLQEKNMSKATMPIPPSVNPVEIARIALKRLAERGMPPTPENYAQFYNAIVTIKSPEEKNQ